MYVITRSDVMGGASVHLIELAYGMQELGHEVIVLAGGQGVFHALAAARGIKAYSLEHLKREIDILSDIRAIVELLGCIRRIQPDLIHLHSSKAGIVGRVAAAICRVPAVFTAHGWAFTEGVSPKKRLVYRWVERLMASYAKAIITVSNYDRNLALSLGVGAPGSMATIHNGMPDVHAETERVLEFPLRIIMVARFDAPKDQAQLIQAMALVKTEHWILEFVGDGPELEKCVDIANKLGLSDRIIFSGACNDVAERLSRSHLFVLISHWEGLPLTILEAMRSGLPVVASKVGGVPEAVQDQVSGFLVDPNDTVAIAEKIEFFAANIFYVAKMGNSGREKFLREFTFDLMCTQTFNVYESVLG